MEPPGESAPLLARSERGYQAVPALSRVLEPATSPANQPSPDFLVWQLIDSAFPTGGFAHSGGLEAAWQHGEVRSRVELGAYLETSLEQISRSQIPFVTAVHATPASLFEVDQLCDAFTTNHVANRASRLQGRALLNAAIRIFLAGEPAPTPPPCGHWAPVFGYVTQRVGLLCESAVDMFAFNHLRSLLAAAVRLNIVGPVEAQILQFRLSETARKVARFGLTLTLDDLAQTAPLTDLWQGAQDRLYSRLFQS